MRPIALRGLPDDLIRRNACMYVASLSTGEPIWGTAAEEARTGVSDMGVWRLRRAAMLRSWEFLDVLKMLPGPNGLPLSPVEESDRPESEMSEGTLLVSGEPDSCKPLDRWTPSMWLSTVLCSGWKEDMMSLLI